MKKKKKYAGKAADKRYARFAQSSLVAVTAGLASPSTGHAEASANLPSMQQSHPSQIPVYPGNSLAHWFAPDSAIAREQAAAVLARVFKTFELPNAAWAAADGSDSASSFHMSGVSAWAEAEVNEAWQLDLLLGAPSGNPESQAALTNGQSADMLFRMLKKAGLSN